MSGKKNKTTAISSRLDLHFKRDHKPSLTVVSEPTVTRAVFVCVLFIGFAGHSFFSLRFSIPAILNGILSFWNGMEWNIEYYKK